MQPTGPTNQTSCKRLVRDVGERIGNGTGFRKHSRGPLILWAPYQTVPPDKMPHMHVDHDFSGVLSSFSMCPTAVSSCRAITKPPAVSYLAISLAISVKNSEDQGHSLGHSCSYRGRLFLRCRKIHSGPNPRALDF
jgi:hypothetical protein